MRKQIEYSIKIDEIYFDHNYGFNPDDDTFYDESQIEITGKVVIGGVSRIAKVCIKHWMLNQTFSWSVSASYPSEYAFSTRSSHLSWISYRLCITFAYLLIIPFTLRISTVAVDQTALTRSN